MATPAERWSEQLKRWVLHACLLEVRSQKPGNVTPDSQFDDVDVTAFERSAAAVSDVLSRSATNSVGQSILESIRATRAVVDSNTNLGIVLLLAPLASVPDGGSLRDQIGPLLQSLTVEDAAATFEAIRLAAPGGLGDAETQDVADAPSETLTQCMVLAADRDTIAKQYRDDFFDVIVTGLTWLGETRDWKNHLERRIGWLALRILSEFGDSLIARKCGEEASREVARRAALVLDAGWPHVATSHAAFDDLDAYLRRDGNQLNPGTTADMIAAILFAALREGIIEATQDVTGFVFKPGPSGA